MPEKDEKGEMINPHIPNYIASVPWYIDPEKKPSLFHQHKLKAEAKHTIGDWYHRGVPDNKTVGRFRKGKKQKHNSNLVQKLLFVVKKSSPVCYAIGFKIDKSKNQTIFV
jgi:hypothetical protein